jgi:predicted permease
MPMEGSRSMSAHSFEGQPIPPGSVPPIIANTRVTPGYFETLRQPLVAGRTFAPADHQQPRGAVVVTRSLAEQRWPGEDPIGKRLQNGLPDPEDPQSWERNWHTVVGVVADTRFDGLSEDVVPMIYYVNGPLLVEDRGWFDRTLTVVVRTAGDVHPLALAEPVRETIWALDPNLPVANVRTAQTIVDDSMARTSFTMVLLLIAAAVALTLGAVGLYGVISYIVSLRTQEIGIRMALGADAGDVARRVVRQGLAVAGIGAALGVVAAFAATRLMASLLFGVSPTDPLTFAGVSGALMATAALASWLPARRAAGVDPLVALRHE